MSDEHLRRFRAAYARHRAAEGRGAGGAAELLALPYLGAGPHAAAWRIRARTFDHFVAHVVRPCAAAVRSRPLRVLDLGAGCGWLAYRLRRQGHHAVALDVRTDAVDGLGAATAYDPHLDAPLARAAASFDALPVAGGWADVVVYNASIHYALELEAVLGEAVRVTMPGGRIVILDSPFYRTTAAGDAMVAEKRRRAEGQFGELAEDLLALPFIEYLTPARLETASAVLGLRWRRHRVRYPLRYEARPLAARLRRRRPPSRFDLWEATSP